MSRSLNGKPKPTLSPVMMLAPAAVLLLGYHYGFHQASRTRLATVRAQESKLVTDSQTFDRDARDHFERMRRLKSEQQLLDQRCQAAEAEKQVLREQREALIQRFVFCTRPAETVRSVVRLVESHGMTVLDNEIDPTSAESIARKERKELAILLALPQTDHDAWGAHRLVIEGTFPEMRRAMHAIRQEIPFVAINSLSLHEADPRTDLRIWTLSLSHWRPNRISA